MPLGIDNRRIAALAALLGLAFAVGCGSDRNPIAPATTNATPIEIRADAAAYGTVEPVTIQSVELSGRTLRLQVTYGGGCHTHTFAAAASPHFMESYPPQLAVFLRHDGGNDLCSAAIFRTLSFDVTPAVLLHHATYGAGPFYLYIVTPGDTQHPRILIRH